MIPIYLIQMILKLKTHSIYNLLVSLPYRLIAYYIFFLYLYSFYSFIQIKNIKYECEISGIQEF